MIKTFGCTIKPINENQESTLLDLYHACEDFLALGPQPRASLDMVCADLAHSQADCGVYCGIWNGQEELIGVVDYIAGGFEGYAEQGYISLLMLAPSHRTAGIGSEVALAVEQRLAEGGVARVLCDVQVNNVSALRFWQKIGYHIESGPEAQEDGTVTYRLAKNLDLNGNRKPSTLPRR